MEENMIGIRLISITNRIRRKAVQNGFSTNSDKSTNTQQWFLSYIWKNSSQSDVFQKDLENEFSISRPTASEILKTMERKGLITRQPAQQDARLKKILLTDKAKGMCCKNEKIIQELEANLIRGFSKEELEMLFHLLNKLKKNIDN